jgi:xanthine/uracil permease
MYICPRLTGIVTLLIGLQLFSPIIAEAEVQPHHTNNLSEKQLVVAAKATNSPVLDKMMESIQVFVPPDNEGPNSTQGSGTR